MTRQEDAEAVRKALHYAGHPTGTIADHPETNPHLAFARLTAALEAAERERQNAEDRTRASDRVREKWQSRAEAAERRVVELEARCPLCQHEWRRHDPEDGMCDAPGPCRCGRDPAFHRVRNAALSRAKLDPDIARAALEAAEEREGEHTDAICDLQERLEAAERDFETTCRAWGDDVKRVEAAERERDRLKSTLDAQIGASQDQLERAEAAEQRVVELEATLREIVKPHQSTLRIPEIARAALGEKL